MKSVGINDQCTQWLIDNHFNNKFKGDFFNFLAYHERCIVSKALDILKVYNPDAEMYRRHDSLVSFDSINFSCLDGFEYLGVKGWFNKYEINV